MRRLWTFGGWIALLTVLVWLTRVAAAETAFEWSLRHRLPRLENRVDLLEQRAVETSEQPPPWAAHLIRLLEAEKAAREGVR